MCYMKPVDVEKNCTKIDDGMDDERDDDDDGQVYILFDFECTQDALIECDEGYRLNTDTGKCNNCGKSACGSYEHEPNLCVAHKVCTECMYSELDQESYCDQCLNNRVELVELTLQLTFVSGYSLEITMAQPSCVTISKVTTRFQSSIICIKMASYRKSYQMEPTTCQWKFLHARYV
jgi:hypothetical protein